MGKRIALGTDHGGFEVKNALIDILAAQGFQPIDCGTFSADSTDYPIYAGRVALAVSSGAADMGIIVCKSGNGMSMVANRYPGVRAGIGYSPHAALLTREHNNANVLVLAAEEGQGDPGEIVSAFLSAEFGGGRHKRRVEMIEHFDRLNTSSLPTYQMIAAGQSPWLDDISDDLITSGRLAELVKTQGLRGMTSNPTIFEKAIGKGAGAYPSAIRKLRSQEAGVDTAYEKLTTHDIERAADVMRSVYSATGGDDGFVSLEVAPKFGDDEAGTVAEALRLNALLARPNVMIKVPGTEAGIRAVRKLTAEGLNINITLLFSLEHYRAAARAYIAGIQDRVSAGLPVHQIRSVASVFVSRIDVAINEAIEDRLEKMSAGVASRRLEAALNRTATANCQRIYQAFADMFIQGSFVDLARFGAAPQRPLWASTGVKSDDIPATYYVDGLVAPFTVNTMPAATLKAVTESGLIHRNALMATAAEGEETLRILAENQIDLDATCNQLQKDGLDAFAKSFDALYATLEKALAEAMV